ncbi:MAG: hypothetical protein JO326_05345 [Acetobacteraceae bacterium]|nr:hypothetical protein [Acetobacteraceae bacterium]
MTAKARWRAFAAVALVVGALPLAVCQPAPFVDWPNHLARVFIDLALLRGDPFWSHFYTINPHPVPNEALDLAVGGLAWAGLSVDAAGTLFLLAAYAVFAGGLAAFSRALGAGGRGRALLGALLFSTGPLMYGLVNYVAGLGLALWLLAAWLRGGPRWRWLLMLGGTALLFYVHLFAAAVFVLVGLCFELWTWRRSGLRRVLGRASAVGGGAVFLALLLLSQVSGESLPDASGDNVFWMGQPSPFGVLRWKLALFVRQFTDHASLTVGVVTWLALVGLAALALTRGRPRIAAPVAMAGGVLLAGVLVLPESAGTGSLLDYRLVLPLLALGAAALRLDWQTGAARRIAFALIASLLTLRGASFAASFAHEQAVYRAFDAAVLALPRGSILLTARGRTDAEISPQEWWGPPTEHLSTRAVRFGLLVPTVFAVASQQPIVLRSSLDPWRHEWRIADAAEFDAAMADVEPLCRAARGQGRDVFLFVAYPGSSLDGADPSAVVVATGAFRILDACRLPRVAGFAMGGEGVRQ